MMGLISREQIAGMNCHYYNYSLKAFFASMQRNGYQTVALWGGAPHFYLDYASFSSCKGIKRLANEYGQKIQCFVASSGTYGYQIGMQQKDQAERCFAYFSNGIHAAAELGADQMCVNSGWGYRNENRSEAWKRSAEMLSRLADVAREDGVILTMESLRQAESLVAYTCEDVAQMLDEINHPNLRAMIDTTAMRVAGETMEQWFERLGSRIVNTHFVDGTPYGHLAWGDGCQDLEGFLQTMKKHSYTGLLGLEITARRYYEKPEEADRQNMAALERYL